MAKNRLALIPSVLALCSLLNFFLPSYAQPVASSDSTQINKLKRDLCEHVVKPSDLLDPQMENSERARNLKYLEGRPYELTMDSSGDIQFQNKENAELPVRIHFRNEDSELETTANVQFVKRNGIWYFANYSFVSFPLALMVIIVVVGSAVGITYAAGALITKRRLQREGNLKGINLLKIFIPLFWFRTTQRNL